MKKLNLLKISFLILGIILFNACKKDKPSQKDLLLGTWNISSLESKTIQNNQVTEVFNYAGKDGDLITFKNDNTVSYVLDGEKDNMTFEILPNNKLLIDEDVYIINTLTKNLCALTLKIGDDKNYDEQVVNLKR